MGNALINILTRSSGRPRGFHSNYLSVKNQTYNNIRHIVSYDNEEDLNYLQNYDVIKLKTHRKKQGNQPSQDRENNIYFPQNLYCNDLMNEVNEGWIMFLDDDDRLFHNKVIEELVEQIKTVDEDTLIIWQMRYPNGKVVPPNKIIANQKIEINKIGSPCFLFHSKYKNKASWDAYKRSDYRFIKQLGDLIPHKLFIRKVYIQLNNFGDFGKRNDVKVGIRKKLPFLFYKNSFWTFFPKKHSTFLNIQIFNYLAYVHLFSALRLRIENLGKKIAHQKRISK